ncbi:24009_t:CDS:2 [Gigaspora margarita]|uniref:24009_t:CDS:1 n=1 Tax=Gigaspora margarita TaxID=4874 RepID=A0ABN7UFY7_GIGMA|nr:24009_t:CDS:2 [Gigaspora margarita]
MLDKLYAIVASFATSLERSLSIIFPQISVWSKCNKKIVPVNYKHDILDNRFSLDGTHIMHCTVEDLNKPYTVKMYLGIYRD